MCDELVIAVGAPIAIVAVVGVGVYRILKGILYDAPMYLFRLRKRPQDVKPHIQEPLPLQALQPLPEIPQPHVLRITIPVCEDPVEV